VVTYSEAPVENIASISARWPASHSLIPFARAPSPACWGVTSTTDTARPVTASTSAAISRYVGAAGPVRTAVDPSWRRSQITSAVAAPTSAQSTMLIPALPSGFTTTPR
jgi:hypothetical protein